MPEYLLLFVSIFVASSFAELPFRLSKNASRPAALHAAGLTIYSNDTWFTYFNHHVFPGNALFETASGVVTLTTLEESVPTRVLVYDSAGSCLLQTSFPRVINFQLSDNRQYAGFYDGTCLRIIDTRTGISTTHPPAIIFCIDANGHPAYYSAARHAFVYRSLQITLPRPATKAVWFNDAPCVVSGSSLVSLIDDRLSCIYTADGLLVDVSAHAGTLYLVERSSAHDEYIFTLLETRDLETFMHTSSSTFPKRPAALPGRPATHASIRAPLNYYDSSYPFRIGNSYAEIQEYGGDPYLHPGVDLLGLSSQQVFAVHSGVVKAVLSTGGSLYWRVAVANENITNSTEGYLYAHLIENSIAVTVGDTVSAGDVLGKLVPWPVADFTHIHFARIRHNGETWDGNWFTIDNPLVDITNKIDHSPPVFENARNSDLFAFRTADGDYLPPDGLFNGFNAIVKCHDLANSDWRVDVWDLAYTLHPFNYPGFTIYSEPVYAFDMPLGLYAGTSTLPILSNIYSRDTICYSIGNYSEREYFHIVTNSFNQLPPGPYRLAVTARDAALNAATTSMPITIIGNPPAGILAVDTLHLDFGQTIPGKTNTQTLTIMNTGTIPQPGIILNTAAPFHTISNSAFTLSPQSNITVTLAFSPQQLGAFTNTITLAGNGTITIILTAQSIPEPTTCIILILFILLYRKGARF